MSLIKNNWALPFHLSPRFSLFPPFFLFFCVASFGRHCRTSWFCERNMADKPSRALVLVGDGLARFISPSHTHLHTLASLACCGFLTLPHSPSQVFAFFFLCLVLYLLLNCTDYKEWGSFLFILFTEILIFFFNTNICFVHKKGNAKVGFIFNVSVIRKK